ncbi:MAG: hypothetical protein SF339_26605 [Blastocatellia bacterium]|nr:hypothetical protein [Blastocatellia bacterium]
MTDEQREALHRVYKRAGIGLGVAALLWTGAILLGGRLEENNVRWLIPAGAAALSIYCFSLYAKSRDEE